MKVNYIQSACLGESFQPIGKQWVNEFIQHYNKIIKSHRSASLSTIHAQSANPMLRKVVMMGTVLRGIIIKTILKEIKMRTMFMMNLVRTKVKFQVDGMRLMKIM